MATMEMQVDEHTKRVLQESITTATQEREALQEIWQSHMEQLMDEACLFRDREETETPSALSHSHTEV